MQMLPVTMRKPRFSVAQESAAESTETEWESEPVGAYPVDIWEDGLAVIVEAELPGFCGDSVDVSVDEQCLRLFADRQPENSSEKKYLSERQFVRIQRTFKLPAAVDAELADARLEDGVLRLRLPKTQRTRPATIPVR
jgi:HSP20 family protein